MFTLDTSSRLQSIRTRGTALHLSLFLLIALIVKTAMYYYMDKMPAAESKKLEHKTQITWTERYELQRQKKEVLNRLHDVSQQQQQQQQQGSTGDSQGEGDERGERQHTDYHEKSPV